MTPADITILGAGVAGLTAGLALARRGWRVRVLEQAPALADLGAGLQVSPNGLAVLRALGLEEALMAHTLASEGAVLRDGLSGADVARIPLSDRYRLTHRVALIGILAEAAREAGVDLRLGQRIEDLTLGAPVRLHLAGGEKVETGLVIGADGIKSKLRRALEPAAA
ncbi:MAG: FAD-dependent oxidoreductase, partial [Pseudomonadota bacterium]